MILFFLACLGLTKIITHSSMGDKIKTLLHVDHVAWLAELLSCSLCCGLWVGLILSPMIATSLLDVLACGFASAALCEMVVIVENYLINEKTP